MSSSATSVEESFQPFALTPLDHTVPRVYTSILLSFRSPNRDAGLDRIQAAVESLVSCLPFLRGEIRSWVNSNSTSGPMGVHHPSTHLQAIPMLSTQGFPGQILPIAQYHRPSHLDGDNTASSHESYYPLSAIIAPSDPQPLLRFQANVLDDGILLGISFSHLAFDGYGMMKLIEMFATCCRASSPDAISLPTNSDNESQLRRRLANLEPLRDSVAKNSAVDDPRPAPRPSAIPRTNANVAPESLAIQSRGFAFSAWRILGLRNACNQVLDRLLRGEEDQTNNKPKYLSSNDVFSSMLALCLDTARAKATARPLKSVSLTIIVNLRQRMIPPFPPQYLGNTCRSVRVKYRLPPPATNPSIQLQPDLCPWMDQKQLIHIAQIALRVRTEVDSTDDEYVRSLMSDLRRRENWEKVDFGNWGTLVSSWRGISPYAFDFGSVLGKIDYLDRSPAETDGMCFVLPDKGGGGAPGPWEVRLALEAGAMAELIRDNLLRSFWRCDRPLL